MVMKDHPDEESIVKLAHLATAKPPSDEVGTKVGAHSYLSPESHDGVFGLPGDIFHARFGDVLASGWHAPG